MKMRFLIITLFCALGLPLFAEVQIVLSGNTVDVPEGGTSSTLTVVLSEATNKTVKVYANWSSGDPGIFVRPSESIFTFTTDNWNTPQVVQVMATEDFDGTNNTSVIEFSANDLTSVNLTATELDNDAFVIPFRELGVWSDNDGVIPIKLAAVPAGDTTVTVANVAGNANISVTSGSTLVFTTGNWDTAQTTTVHVASDVDTLCTPATIRASASGLTNCDVEVWEQETATYFITTNVLHEVPGRMGLNVAGGGRLFSSVGSLSEA